MQRKHVGRILLVNTIDISNTHEVITDTNLAEDTTQAFKCFPRHFRLLDNKLFYIVQITDNDLAIII